MYRLSATPMTAMQIFYSLMKLDQVQDVVFVKENYQTTCVLSLTTN
ncbi:MAG: hypothetical protein Ct9H90mP24_3670 [Methanobacteriota archaeon]|nr:MAG: hypothetical protein Ct9H90mP24_3670 [Euryarchaeota archaeon]